jgi:gliding motility-associated-like protein
MYTFNRLKSIATLFFVVLVFAGVTGYGQVSTCPPANIGFEDGTFNHWQCDTGSIGNDGYINLVPSGVVYNRHTIIDKNFLPMLDPFGSFPTLCPNGSKYSIRLGSTDTLRKAERVSYTFTIPPGASQYNLIFSYAVVLQNPAHVPVQQPRFTVKTFDVTDSTDINCASFDFVAAANLPGFKLAPGSAFQRAFIYYKDWSSTVINLNGYAGKTVRIAFTANDCALGAHFGYAYLDLTESCSSPVTGNAYCTGQTSLTLSSPSGFGSYTWYKTDNLSTPIGNEQTFNVSPPPPDQSKYAVVVTPLNGNGCVDTLYTVVSKIDAGFTFKVADTLYACADHPADLTAPTVTAGSGDSLIYSYYADAQGLQYLHTPASITQSGTYYIEAVSPQGCTNILPVYVSVVDSSVLKVTNPAPVPYPATVDITSTFTHNSNFKYTYYANSNGTGAVNGTQIAESGTYYIQAQSTHVDCSVTEPVKVTITPPPPPSVTAVNTFTPNNDGTNDHFFVTLTGYVTFQSLKIFNRDGQLIFQTNSPDIYWDGTVNGKPANVGTYYWVFEGTNSYYHTKVYQAGYIALIR